MRGTEGAGGSSSGEFRFPDNAARDRAVGLVKDRLGVHVTDAGNPVFRFEGGRKGGVISDEHLRRMSAELPEVEQGARLGKAQDILWSVGNMADPEAIRDVLVKDGHLEAGASPDDAILLVTEAKNTVRDIEGPEGLRDMTTWNGVEHDPIAPDDETRSEAGVDSWAERHENVRDLLEHMRSVADLHRNAPGDDADDHARAEYAEDVELEDTTIRLLRRIVATGYESLRTDDPSLPESADLLFAALETHIGSLEPDEVRVARWIEQNDTEHGGMSEFADLMSTLRRQVELEMTETDGMSEAVLARHERMLSSVRLTARLLRGDIATRYAQLRDADPTLPEDPAELLGMIEAKVRRDAEPVPVDPAEAEAERVRVEQERDADIVSRIMTGDRQNLKDYYRKLLQIQEIRRQLDSMPDDDPGRAEVQSQYDALNDEVRADAVAIFTMYTETGTAFAEFDDVSIDGLLESMARHSRLDTTTLSELERASLERDAQLAGEIMSGDHNDMRDIYIQMLVLQRLREAFATAGSDEERIELDARVNALIARNNLAVANARTAHEAAGTDFGEGRSFDGVIETLERHSAHDTTNLGSYEAQLQEQMNAATEAFVGSRDSFIEENARMRNALVARKGGRRFLSKIPKVGRWLEQRDANKNQQNFEALDQVTEAYRTARGNMQILMRDQLRLAGLSENEIAAQMVETRVNEMQDVAANIAAAQQEFAKEPSKFASWWVRRSKWAKRSMIVLAAGAGTGVGLGVGMALLPFAIPGGMMGATGFGVLKGGALSFGARRASRHMTERQARVVLGQDEEGVDRTVATRMGDETRESLDARSQDLVQEMTTAGFNLDDTSENSFMTRLNEIYSVGVSESSRGIANQNKRRKAGAAALFGIGVAAGNISYAAFDYFAKDGSLPGGVADRTASGQGSSKSVGNLPPNQGQGAPSAQEQVRNLGTGNGHGAAGIGNNLSPDVQPQSSGSSIGGNGGGGILDQTHSSRPDIRPGHFSPSTADVVSSNPDISPNVPTVTIDGQVFEVGKQQTVEIKPGDGWISTIEKMYGVKESAAEKVYDALAANPQGEALLRSGIVIDGPGGMETYTMAGKYAGEIGLGEPGKAVVSSTLDGVFKALLTKNGVALAA
jgi:hypothetical protein